MHVSPQEVRADGSNRVALDVSFRESGGPALDSTPDGQAGRRGGWETLAPVTALRAGIWLFAIVVLAAAVHVALLLVSNPAPSVFDDELAYQKLAQSLGQSARLAMFGKQGLSYSPLYPLVLAPIYALALSGTAAYHAALVLNCILVAVAGFPLYQIARFALSPARAIVAVGLSALAPLMLYSSFVMSENLAYPLFLFAVWSILVTVRTPSVRADGTVLALCCLCAGARLQFFVLLPAALAAIVLAAVVAHPAAPLRRLGALSRALRAHALLVVANVLLAAGGIAVYTGSGVIGLTGMYANQKGRPAPYPWRIGRLLAEHVAGLDLSVGVIPFVGTLVAAAFWLRRRGNPETDAFATVAASVGAAVIAITAIAAYDEGFPPGADLQRIHERYFFYLVPLFLIALIATLGVPRSPRLLWVSLVAAIVAALLPTVVPFGTVINRTAGIDSFGLEIFLTSKHGAPRVVPHALALAVLLAACLGILYALARAKPAIVIAALASFFVWVSTNERSYQASAAASATRASFSSARDWVDSVDRGQHVPLVENPHFAAGGEGVGETSFFNLSVDRLYYVCRPVLSPPFGEQQVVIGPGGRLLIAGMPIRTTYAVVPARLGIEGRVLATDARARLVVVQPTGGILRVSPGARESWACG